MRHPNWKVAGAAGLAAGLAVGGFSLVSASGVERAVRTVELRESQATPAADSMRLVMARATTAPTHSLDPASPDKPTVTTPSVVSHEPAASPKATPAASPKATPAASPKATVHRDDCADCADCANGVHRDDCADCADCANGVHCADSATSVDSVSVDSVDSDD